MTTTARHLPTSPDRLSPAEEVDLARTVEAGVLAAEALTYGIQATPDELAALARAGQAARERFLLANHGLVVTIAVEEVRGSAATLDELVQEGHVGLAQALERYDYRRGRFGPFAAAWVRQVVRDAAVTGCGRRVLTRRQAALLNELRTTEAELTHRHGREIGVAEIGRQARTDTRTVEWLREARVVGDVEQLTLVDESAAEAFTAVEESLPVLEDLLRHLSSVERLVVCGRFGVGCEPGSYAEVGARLGLSASSVRRVEHRALRVLRGVLGDSDQAA